MGDMPPVPCPDCLTPTEYVDDVFRCPKDGQVFTTPFGLDMSMAQELWTAWNLTLPAGDIEETPALPEDMIADLLERLGELPDLEYDAATAAGFPPREATKAAFEAGVERAQETIVAWLAGRTVLEPAGYMVIGPEPKNGHLLADWDGEVHETREEGDEALSDCRRNYPAYDLYALHRLASESSGDGSDE